MAAPGGLLGRDEQIEELARLLGRERLVTLVGAPGIGKSRLALELGSRLEGSAAGGAHLVELAPVARARDVPRALAAVLSVEEVPGQKLTDTLIARLSKHPAPVVLDNCEHLLGACAKLAEALLEGCPDIRIVATTREPLALDGEIVWQVPPLALPAPGRQLEPQSLLAYAAVALFVERAAAAQPGFALTAYVAASVVEICRRLDGIPLAIELAAARVESLTPEEIARRLEDRFSLLADRSFDAAGRHRTLRAALDWSYDLLSEPEQALLRRLSVFAGSFDLDAAEAVCTKGKLEAGRDVAALAALVDKSLVLADADCGRYRLLETIRAYAGERLQAAGEASAVRGAHAGFYLALAEQAEPELTGPDQERWLERLEAERANLRSAIEWSLGHGDAEESLRLTGALVLYWRVRCHFSEGRELLDAAVSASDGAAPELRAKALWGAGFMAVMLGEIDRAVPLLEESLACFRVLKDARSCARSLLLLGNCAQYRPGQSALALLEESAALARDARDSWCLAHALGIQGLDHASRDALPAARLLLEECLLVAREARDKQGLRLGLFGLGSVALRQGDFRLAESVLEEALDLTGALGEAYSNATALQYLGQLAGERGDYGRARELLERALAVLQEVGPPHAPLDALALLAGVRRAEGDRREARQLFEQALTLVRGLGGVHLPTLHGLGGLAAEEDNPDAARPLFEEALELGRARGDKGGSAHALHGLGRLARDAGELQRAAALHAEALQLQREIGDAPGMAASLEAVAGVAAAAGRHEHAARLLGAATAIRAERGYARSRSETSRYEADLILVRRALGPKELDTAFAEGGRLSLEQAATRAAEWGTGPEEDSGTWSSLTASEREVADLVAEGLTNPQIAQRLFIARGTVKFHLSNIFRKVGVEGRMELAREVWQRRRDPIAGDR